MAEENNNGFDFGRANDEQIDAITHTEGPLLITAGPGTGKTFTLVQRAAYLIEERKVEPEQIMMTTFTEKAAKELITRITNELGKHGVSVNLNEMYIGTFHSICNRILQDNAEAAGLKKGFRVLEPSDQKYMINKHINDFRDNGNWDDFYRAFYVEKTPEEKEESEKKYEGKVFENKYSGWWNRVENHICPILNKLHENMADIEAMKKSDDPKLVSLAKMDEIYQRVMNDENALDYASVLERCYFLLRDNPEVLKGLQEKIKYFMVDEYQDTDHVQEAIVMLLGSENNNICVVGDDDQAMYRFRGATIDNILSFPYKEQFMGPDGATTCKTIPLVTNYRSNGEIVDFYNKWMETTSSGKKFEFSWGKWRNDREIKPHKNRVASHTVVKLSSEKNKDEWHRKILNMINELMDSGKISNYNQIAFLFRSVTLPNVINLANYLEENNVPVYSPRSGMFFTRIEVKQAVGCLMKMFPFYTERFQGGKYDKFEKLFKKDGDDTDLGKFYKESLDEAEKLMEGDAELKKFINDIANSHNKLKDKTDYGFTDLLYMLFGFKPFCSEEMLGADLKEGVYKTRAARNLADLTQHITKYESIYNITELSAEKTEDGMRKIDEDVERFFNFYLKNLYNSTLNEYEDESEYAPSGCVSFMTFHGAKGMEFPVVFIGSLAPKMESQKKDPDIIIKAREYFNEFCKIDSDDVTEKEEYKSFYDFWRLFYVAFSRAEDLLVLTADEGGGGSQTVSKYLSGIYKELPVADEPGVLNLQDFDEFEEVKPVNLMNTYSFTSQVSVYDKCPLQYKFFKELGFAQGVNKTAVFGTLAHETIEDIHDAALQGKTEEITEENITAWFNENYRVLKESGEAADVDMDKEKKYLDEALNQVQRYARNQAETWGAVAGAEEDIEYVRLHGEENLPNYIIEGKIDLVLKEDEETVHLVDFKTESKPDETSSNDSDKEKVAKMHHYKKQLELYAWLIGHQQNKKVSKMSLYYTGDQSENPMVTFPYDEKEINQVAEDFDATVMKIENKEFAVGTGTTAKCRDCAFKYYCKKD